MAALAVPDEAPRFRTMRLTLTGGDLPVRALQLRYADAGRETQPLDIVLRRGTTTLLHPAPGRRLVSIRVDYGRYTGNRYLQLSGSADVPPVPLPRRPPWR